MKDLEGLSPEHRKLVEELAELEHTQWRSWTLALEPEMPKEVVERWKKNWKPYAELSEMNKDLDRRWALCVLDILTKGLPKCRLCGDDPSQSLTKNYIKGSKGEDE